MADEAKKPLKLRKEGVEELDDGQLDHVTGGSVADVGQTPPPMAACPPPPATLETPQLGVIHRLLRLTRLKRP